MSVKRWDTAGTMFDIVLRGELFKAGESNPNKLRWCEISADGMLTWADKEDQLPKDKSSLSLRGALITPEPDRKPITAGEARYGLRIQDFQAEHYVTQERHAQPDLFDPGDPIDPF